MHTFKKALMVLEESREFSEWKKTRKDDYLSYGFSIKDECDWKIGYYNKETDKLISFTVYPSVRQEPEEDAFKEPGKNILPLDKEKINIDSDSALKTAEEFQKKHYPHESAIKVIMIIQKLENLSNVWNITFVTSHFNTLNIKLSAENGKILEHKLDSIMALRKE